MFVRYVTVAMVTWPYLFSNACVSECVSVRDGMIQILKVSLRYFKNVMIHVQPYIAILLVYQIARIFGCGKFGESSVIYQIQPAKWYPYGRNPSICQTFLPTVFNSKHQPCQAFLPYGT